jgi:hypothetical protein
MKKSCKGTTVLLLVLLTMPVLLSFVNYEGYPSDVLSFFGEWKITLGDLDATTVSNLTDYENEDYFYNVNDGATDWVVYKTPNTGGTTANSSNTRSELRQKNEWTPETGGKLTGTLKVMHVSTTGDARVPATFSVVVGQIHSSEGHENEPIKIFYKKFPGQTKGSVFWNYEINTDGDSNDERWDYSLAVWGNDWSVVGSSADTYPDEPTDGIELDEEFSYEINVYEGIMYLTFKSEGHETKTFTKSLVESDFSMYENIPQQVLTVFSSTGQDGVERDTAYKGELQYFKQGAYNQTNGKDPEDNMIWNTGADFYEGDLDLQYANGSYVEVWFKEATVGASTTPIDSEDPDPVDPVDPIDPIDPEDPVDPTDSTDSDTTDSSVPGLTYFSDTKTESFTIYPNPTASSIRISSTTVQINSLQVLNLNGQLLISKSLVNGTDYDLNLDVLQSGTYLLIIEDEDNRKAVSKVIKQ